MERVPLTQQEVRNRFSKLNIVDWKLLSLFYKSNSGNPESFSITEVSALLELDKNPSRHSLNKLVKFEFLTKFNSFINIYQTSKCKVMQIVVLRELEKFRKNFSLIIFKTDGNQTQTKKDGGEGNV